MPGKRIVVTRMAKGSTSDAHSGAIPARVPPNGNPPEPSKRLPRVSCLFSRTAFHLFHKVGIGQRLSITLHGYLIRVAEILHIAAKDDGGILGIQLGHIADAIGLLTGHHGGAAAAEGVQHDAVLLAAVRDGIGHQIQRLARRMILIALGLGEIPDGGLLSVRVPGMLSVLQKPVQHRLMLPLIITAAQHQAVLHPDAAPGKMESRVHKCTAEVQPFGVRMEHIRRATLFQSVRHILQRQQQETVELFILDAVVLDGQSAGALEGDSIRRVRHDEIGAFAAHESLHVFRLGGVSAEQLVPAHSPQIAGFHKCRFLQRGGQVEIVILCFLFSSAHHGRQLFFIKAGEGKVVGHLLQGFQFYSQQVFIPACVHGHAVVGQNVRFLLRLGQVIHIYAGDFGEAFLPRGGKASMPGDDVIVAVDKHGIDKAKFPQRSPELSDLLRAVGTGVINVGNQAINRHLSHFVRCDSAHILTSEQSPLGESLKSADGRYELASFFHDLAVGQAVHGIIANGAAQRHRLSGALGFQESVDIDGHVRLGQVFAMQAAARHAVRHVAAQLTVGRAGIHIRAACPFAQRIDLRAGVLCGEVSGRGVALADNQSVAVQNVLAVTGMFCIDGMGDGGELFLLLRQRHALEDAVVSAADALRLICSQMLILRYLAVVHDHAFTGDAGHGILYEGGRDMYGGFRNDVADAMPNEDFHGDTGISLYGIGVLHQRAGDAIRQLVGMGRIHFLDHFLLLLALNSFSMASS
nr:MAG TPA: hypothetical protein [Caudoviricetes sp.]